MVWSPPGSASDSSRWRLDIARPKRGKGGTTWRPPGVDADRGNTQFHLPEGVSPTSVADHHMLVSPPGSAAPRGLPNWNPKSRTMTPPGEQAPVDELNLSPFPSSGLASPTPASGSAGVGAGQEGPNPENAPGGWWIGDKQVQPTFHYDSSLGAWMQDDTSPQQPRRLPTQSDQGLGVGQAEGDPTYVPDASSVTSIVGDTPAAAPASTTQQGGQPAGPPGQGAQPVIDTTTGEVIGNVTTEMQSKLDPNTGQYVQVPSQVIHWKSGAAPKNQKTVFKDKDGTHIVTTGPDGKVVSNEIVGGGAAPSRPVTVGSNSGLYDPNTNQWIQQPGAPNAPRGSGHMAQIQKDDGLHQVWVSTDDQGNPTGQTDLGLTRQPNQPAPHALNRNDPAYIDSQGNVVPNPYYDPAASRPTGISGNDPYIWDPNAGNGKGAMVKNPGYSQSQQAITAGNQVFAFDPSTGGIKPIATTPTQQSIQDVNTPSGGREIFGVDPYTNQPTEIYHQGGEPRAMDHNIYLPEDWTGSYPVFDPAHPSQPTMGHHQGTAWSPPASFKQLPPAGAASPPAAAPQTEASVPPAAMPSADDWYSAWQQRQGADTAQQRVGAQADAGYNVGRMAGGLANVVGGAVGGLVTGAASEIPPSDSLDVGGGQDMPMGGAGMPSPGGAGMPGGTLPAGQQPPNWGPKQIEEALRIIVSALAKGGMGGGGGTAPSAPPSPAPGQAPTPPMPQPGPQGIGAPAGPGGPTGMGQDSPRGVWKPPIDPSQVVGTGHKFGEQVSMEGVHKGVDLQAYRGTPAKSPVDGTVIRVDHNPKGLGITVTIRDTQGHEHTLGHLGSVSVKPGDRVRAGQPVASVGSTGASTGPHLDVREKAPNGAPVDPTAKLGPLAQMPRADNGAEPQDPTGEGQAGVIDMQQAPGGTWRMPPVGAGQDVGVGGTYVNGKWHEELPNLTPTGGSVGGDPSPDPTNPGGSSGAASTPTSPGAAPSTNASIQPNWYDQAQIQNLNAQLQQKAQFDQQDIQQRTTAENNRHQEALASAATAQAQQQENARHNQSLEQLQAAEANLNAQLQVALAGLQSGTQIGIQNAQIAAQFGLQSQQFKQGIATSALQNPWLQRLTGMAPGYGQPGGPGGAAWTPPTGGTSFGQILAGASAAPIPQAGMPQVPNAPQTNLPGGSSVSGGQAQQQAGGASLGGGWTAGGNTGSAGAWGGSPDPGGYVVGNDGFIYNTAGGNTGVRAPAGMPPGTKGASIGALANATQSTPPGPTSPTASQGQPYQTYAPNPGVSTGSQPTNVSFSDFSNWDPFQLAGWRTALEAQGPGAFANQQDYSLNQWGQQGITGPSDTSQLSWDMSGPLGQAQKGMQAEFFGQTQPNWVQGQAKNWAKASNPSAAALT